MSDIFELKYGFDPFNAADGAYDTDGDGVNNAAEELANTNPLIDDYPPVITPPQAVHYLAKHTFTEFNLAELIALTQVSVSDGLDGANCCNLTALGFERGAKNVRSGLLNVTWRAVDTAGNIAQSQQVVHVHPLVNFSAQKTVAEGDTIRVTAVLSGESPVYPLILPIEITGDVDSSDYSIAADQIVINSGTEGYIDIQLLSDFQLEGNEELIVSLAQSVNGGIYKKQSIIISEDNLAPVADVSFIQQAQAVTTAAKDAGEITVQLNILDTNISDTHVIDWQIPSAIIAQVSSDQLSVFIDPLLVDFNGLDNTLLNFTVTITDSGSGQLSQTEHISLPITKSNVRLTSNDTDRDGTSDLSEGYSDLDNDGLPAYLDSSDIPYLQPLHVNAAEVKLMETEPGLTLKLGKYARLQASDGTLLSAQEIAATGLITSDTLVHQNDYFDFEIKNITPFGRSVDVVIPLSTAIPKNAVYRKYTADNTWQNFVEDSVNVISSSQTVNGVCPAPHSALFQAGLIEGNLCLRLTIQDGGVNDADGIANGTIDDPGGLAILPNEVLVQQEKAEKSSSGSVHYVMLMLLGLLGLYRKRSLLLKLVFKVK